MATSTSETPETASHQTGPLDDETLRKIYPTAHIAKCLEAGARPDGRPLGRGRPVSVTLAPFVHCQGSSMVKIGRTTMVAGITAEIMRTTLDAPNTGALQVHVELPAVCSPNIRPGQPPEEAAPLTARLSSILASPTIFDLTQLSIIPGQASWCLYLDLCCLDADGCLFDAALLAGVAALSNLTLPAITVNKNGVVRAGEGDEAPDDTPGGDVDMPDSPAEDGPEKSKALPARSVALEAVPLALTSSTCKGYLLADPSAEEEESADGTISLVLDADFRLVSVYKVGGSASSGDKEFLDCVEMAKLRYAECSNVLEEVLAESA